MWMREERGVGERSRFRRAEPERDRERVRSRERRTLSFDFEWRSEDPRRLLASRSELKRRSRDFGRSLPSFSFDSSFRAALRLFERD